MKNVTALAGVLLLLRLGGCEQSKIKSSIAEDMKDPSSVKFGKFIWIENDGPRDDCGPQFTARYDSRRACPVACVEVNAKNSFGGYTGEKVYLVKKDDSKDSYRHREVWGHSVATCAETYATES